MGLTAALTMLGAFALRNANYLCSKVIKSSIDLDNPDVYLVMAGLMNMRNGEIITASPEIWLYYLAGIKLGQYYNIPTCVSLGTDSKSSDLQMAFEKTMGFLISINAGVNNILGTTCNLDSFNLASYDQVAIDLEFISSISRLVKDFKIKNSNKDFDIIRRSLNNKMYFLEDSSTIENYKKFIPIYIR